MPINPWIDDLHLKLRDVFNQNDDRGYQKIEI